MTLRFTRASQVFEAFATLSGDMATPPSDDDPLVYVDALLKGRTPEDSVSFCAYMLDRRDAVIWAIRCCRAMGSPCNGEEDRALSHAQDWIQDPDESRRAAALAIGLNGDHALPGTWAALAAGGAGGTMIVNESPGPPIPPHMTAKAVRSAVLIALARMPLRERPNYLRDCAALCRLLVSSV